MFLEFMGMELAPVALRHTMLQSRIIVIVRLRIGECLLGELGDGGMKAYKFRGTENFERVADILINRRLYCSEVRHLNDVREADIRVGNDRGKEAELLQFGLSLREALASYRVCSLSKTFNNQLLWAHYASGHSGLAIEVDVPSADATEVMYDDDFIFLCDYIGRGMEAAVRAALAKKDKVWKYEEEVRVITRNLYYEVQEPIDRVILGTRMSQFTIRALAEICSAQGISLERAVVADWGIYTVGVPGCG